MTETYTQSRWSLADLFPAQDSPEMQAAFADMEAGVAAFRSPAPAAEAGDLRGALSGAGPPARRDQPHGLPHL